jgi:hypothetical protein
LIANQDISKQTTSSIFFRGSCVVNAVKYRLLLGALKLLNVILMAVSFGVATILHVVRQGGGVTLSGFLSMRIKLSNLVVFALLLLLWHVVLSLSGLYQSQRLATTRSLIVEAAKATTLATILLAAVMSALRISS